MTITLLAGLTVAACSDGDSPTAVSDPRASNVKTTNTIDIGTTTHATTTTELAAWVEEQVASGNTHVSVRAVDGTDEAWLVVAHTPSQSVPSGESRLLLADGSIVAFPEELSSEHWMRVVSFGGSVAVVASVDRVPVLWKFDTDSGQWRRGPDLGLVEGNSGDTEVAVLGDSLLLAIPSAATDTSGLYVPDEQHGVLVSPTLGLTAMAPPPDGVFVQFTSIVGRHGLILGRDTSAGFEYPLERPWEFDSATNEWTPVPLPEWLTCAPSCQWIAPHEGGDPWLETVTQSGVVVLLPDRSLGVYDPAQQEWRRLESPPFTPATPATAVLSEGFLVAANQPANFDGQAFGSVGVLDLASGTWTVDDALVSDGWQWEARTDGRVALLKVYDGSESDHASTPHFVFDPAIRSWRPATEADAALWVRLGGELEITELATLLG